MRLCLILMVAKTHLVRREYVKIYYRNDPVKYDLGSKLPKCENYSQMLYTHENVLGCKYYDMVNSSANFKTRDNNES
ncbi:hypothetical protein YQE_04675, partial [Dendroctonus ponderosae]